MCRCTALRLTILVGRLPYRQPAKRLLPSLHIGRFQNFTHTYQRDFQVGSLWQILKWQGVDGLFGLIEDLRTLESLKENLVIP